MIFLVAVEDYGIMNTKIKNTNMEDKMSKFLLANDLQPQGYYWISNPGLSDAANTNDTSQYGVGQIPGQSTGDTQPSVDKAQEAHICFDEGHWRPATRYSPGARIFGFSETWC